MALTAFQRDVCRLVADQRVRSGERYVAGGAALNEVLKAARLSRDVDLFHDTADAVDDSFDSDRALLEREGFDVTTVRQRRAFVEADEARALIGVLPAEHVGKCLLDSQGALLQGSLEGVKAALESGRVCYHSGCIRGALPALVDGG